jgi:hypothetical protein
MVIWRKLVSVPSFSFANLFQFCTAVSVAEMDCYLLRYISTRTDLSFDSFDYLVDGWLAPELLQRREITVCPCHIDMPLLNGGDKAFTAKYCSACDLFQRAFVFFADLLCYKPAIFFPGGNSRFVKIVEKKAGTKPLGSLPLSRVLRKT